MTRTGNNNQFWLQSVLGSDAALWEEPLISQNDVNDWKLLMEGAPIKACVKNSDDEILERTPIFTTTSERIGKWVSGEDE